MNTLDLSLRYTYADYLKWFDDIRRELFDGFVHAMSAPSVNHQKISGNLYAHLWNFLSDKNCQVFHAPFDVRLPKNGEKENDKIYTVVQPDICVICDLSKLDKRGCLGAPDLIIEIVSPKNSKRDVKDKFNIYQKSGVGEYWIVRPYDKTVEVFLLNEKGIYFSNGIYTKEDTVPVMLFKGELGVNLAEVFKRI